MVDRLERLVRRPAWIALGLVLWIAAVGLTLRSAQVRSADAVGRLTDMTEQGYLDDTDIDSVRRDLADADDEMAAASRDLNSPLLIPLRITPVVGRQLRSATALADSGAALTAAARSVLDAATDAPKDTGRLELLEIVRDEIDQALVTLDRLDLGPSEALLAPLAEARTEAAETVADVQARLSDSQQIVTGLSSFLDGRTYLVLGTNNAEMRVASGMPLSIGEMTTRNGDAELSDLQNTGALVIEGDYQRSLGLPVAVSVIDDDMAARWGFLNLGDDFRKLTYSPRFSEFVAPQAARMWLANTGSQVDGVLAIDPFAVSALVGLIGTIDVDGVVYDEASTLEYLLVGQYDEFGTTDEALQDERRDVLALFAKTVVAEIQQGDWEVADLYRTLRPLAEGRHLLAYSPDSVQQDAWRLLGVAGESRGNEIGVFVLNNGASKLDPYLAVTVEGSSTVDARDGEPDSAGVIVSLTVTIENNATDQLPAYVVGPWEDLDLPMAGTYAGRIAFRLPATTVPTSIEADFEPDVRGPEGTALVLSAPFVSTPGSTTTFELVIELIDAPSELRLLPSTRYPSVVWDWNGNVFDDVAPYELLLS